MYRTRTRVAAWGIALVAVTAGCSAAGAAQPAPPTPAGRTVSVTGAGRLDFPAPGDDLRVELDAHAMFDDSGRARPLRSWGTVRIVHRVAVPSGPPVLNWGELSVDCVGVGGPVLVVTGRFTRVAPGGPWEPLLRSHERSGVSVYLPAPGAGPARVGVAGARRPGEPELPPCAGTAPSSAVIEGGYRVG